MNYNNKRNGVAASQAITSEDIYFKNRNHELNTNVMHVDKNRTGELYNGSKG